MKSRQLTFGSFRINLAEHALWSGGQRLALGAKPLQLLQYLVRNSGRLVGKHELLDAVWPHVHVGEAVLKTCVGEIRRALRDPVESPRFIVTERGLGYRFIARVGTGNLPSPTTSLIGRESERAAVKGMLAAHRLVTLWGTAGVGKTRLALRVASDLVPEVPHGVWWVDLAAVSEASLVADSVAAALGLRHQSGVSLREALAEACHGRHLLLVLDNCEHVVGACSSLAEALLRECAELTILATSREPMGIAEEAIWTVPPLGVPNPGWGVAEMAACEAVDLFVERARSANPFFAITDRNARAIAQICVRLEGLPLAIELAAGRVRVLAPEQIASRMDDIFNVLGQERRTNRGHHTLKAATDWSYTLLSPKERLLLARLSVFSGSFTIDAAEDVCRDEADLQRREIFEVLVRLVDRSLVKVVTHPSAAVTRYRLLEIIRQYTRKKLPPDSHAYFSRHAEYFLRIVDESAPAIRSGASEQALTRLNHEYDNVRGALQWCRDQEDGSEIGIRLIAALWMYWIRRGMVREGLSWVHALLPGAHQASVPVRAGALCAAGTLSWIHGENEKARAWLEESVRLWRTTDDAVGLGRAMYYLGSLRLDLGELAKAGRTIFQSAELFRVSNSLWDLAVALCGLGKVATRKGHVAKAVSLYEQATLILRAIPDPWILSFSLRHLAVLATSQRHDAAAEAYWRESLALSRSIDEPLGVLHGLEGFAALHLEHGDCPRAARLLGAASSLRQSLHSSVPEIQRRNPEGELTKLHGSIGDEKLRLLWAEGEALSCDEAIALALTASETSNSLVRHNTPSAMKGLRGSVP